MRRHHMIAGGVKNWVGLTLHPSIEDALASLRADGWRLRRGAREPRRARLPLRRLHGEGRGDRRRGALGPSPAALAQADEHVAIPMLGLGESVNVSVAAAVILLEAQRQRAAAGSTRIRASRPTSSSARCSSGAIPTSRAAAASSAGRYPRLAPDGTMLENPFAGAAS